MTEALLIMTSACMLNFTGGVPRPLLEQALDKTGTGKLVQLLDERYLNEEVRILGGNIAIGAQVLFQQKLVLSTTF